MADLAPDLEAADLTGAAGVLGAAEDAHSPYGSLGRPADPPLRRDPLSRAHALLAAHPVFDGHNALPWALRLHHGDDLTPGHYYDLDYGEPAVSTDIPRLRQGRVGAQFWSVQVPTALSGDHAISATLEQIDFVYQLVRAYPEALRLAMSADDVTECRNRGRIACLLGSAGGQIIDSSLGALRALHTLGVRSMLLTPDRNTPWADAAADTPCAGGLTAFGEEVVREMNRLGMLIDLSYASTDTMRHTLSITKAPVFLNRCAARNLTNHRHNVPDDVLAQLPRNGGICMVTFAPQRVTGPVGAATVEDVADHLDHVRNVAGAAHVGLGAGFDTDPAEGRPQGLEDVSGYPRLLAELITRGWSFSDLAGLTWGNALRAMRGAEFAAREARHRRGPSTATIDRLDRADRRDRMTRLHWAWT